MQCLVCGVSFYVKLRRTDNAKTCSYSCRDKYYVKNFSGENSHNWIKDRSKLVRRNMKNDSAYYAWSRAVKVRDGYRCKIANQDCGGILEVHHILPWRSHVELRYETNNGITLCHFHHPRKRAEEKRLVPVLQELVLSMTH